MKRMLCEECKIREASFTVSVVIEKEVRKRHLCRECMMKMNKSLSSGNIHSLLTTILSAVASAKTPEESAKVPLEEPAEEDVTCLRCRTTWSQFRKTGRLGCSGCYEAFREKLKPMLQQMHGGMQHAGRQPLCNEEAQRARSQQEELTRQMEQAVAVEDFEMAAVLRDRIRELAREGEKTT